MGNSSQKFHMDELSIETKLTNLSEDVQTLLAMYRLLSVDDKIAAKRIINVEKLF